MAMAEARDRHLTQLVQSKQESGLGRSQGIGRFQCVD